MTYIDYLNQFNLWLESGTLPASSQLMYYKLLHVFNRAGWPPTVQLDNRRLMLISELGSEASVIRVRRKLVDSGLIRYESGKKGSPNQYFLCKIQPYRSNNESITDSKSDSKSDSKTVSENVSHIKKKNKNKTKTSPPRPPKGARYGGLSKLSQEIRSFEIEDLEGLSSFDVPDDL